MIKNLTGIHLLLILDIQIKMAFTLEPHTIVYTSCILYHEHQLFRSFNNRIV